MSGGGQPTGYGPPSGSPPSGGPPRGSRLSARAVGGLVGFAVAVVLGIGLLVGASVGKSSSAPPAVGVSGGGNPVPSVGPLPGPSVIPTPSPTVQPTGPTPGPSAGPTLPGPPTPPPTIQPTGSCPSPAPPGTPGVELGGGEVVVPTPPPWRVMTSEGDGMSVIFVDDRGNFLWTQLSKVGVPIPGVNAQDQVGFLAKIFLDPSYGWINPRLGTPHPEPVFGRAVSAASITWSASYQSTQGLLPMGGQYFLYDRGDGDQLLLQVGSSPPNAYGSNQPQWQPVVNGALYTFACAS